MIFIVCYYLKINYAKEMLNSLSITFFYHFCNKLFFENTLEFLAHDKELQICLTVDEILTKYHLKWFT